MISSTTKWMYFCFCSEIQRKLKEQIRTVPKHSEKQFSKTDLFKLSKRLMNCKKFKFMIGYPIKFWPSNTKRHRRKEQPFQIAKKKKKKEWFWKYPAFIVMFYIVQFYAQNNYVECSLLFSSDVFDNFLKFP